MQPSKEMKAVIYQIGEMHGHDFWNQESGDLLRCELQLGETIYYPLVIEQLTGTTLRVAHEITNETGEIICDPEVIFFTGYPEWIAMELRQPSSLITSIGLPDKKQLAVTLSDGGRYVKSYDPVSQKNIAIFVKAWAKQLKAANWAKLSTDADDYQQTSFDVGANASGKRPRGEKSFVDKVEDFLDEEGLLEHNADGSRSHRLSKDSTLTFPAKR
jgi:hypothetical protein